MDNIEFYQKIFSENPKVKEKFQEYLKERNKKKELQIFVLNNKLESGYNCPTYFLNFDLAYSLFDDFFNKNKIIIEITFEKFWDLGDIYTEYWMITIIIDNQNYIICHDDKTECKKEAIIKAFELFEKELNNE